MEFSHKVLGKTDRIRTVTSELIKLVPFVVLTLFVLVLCSCVPSRQAEGWSGVSSNDGILYVGSGQGRVLAVNSSSRNIEWSSTIRTPSSGMSCGQTSAPAAIYGTPVVDEDLVFIGSYSGKVYALNIATGAVRWVYPKEGYVASIVGSPLVADRTVYVCSSDGIVYALNTTFGEFKWESEPLAKKLWITPTVEGNTIYVSTYDGNVYTLSVETGSKLSWAFKREVGFVSSPVLYKDQIFVGSFDNNLYAIKIGADEPSWNFTGGNWFWAAPVVNEGVVYAGCLDGKIYAIEAETGKELWEFDAGSPIVASPVLVGDLLVLAAESGDISVFDTDAKPEDKAMTPVKSISINALIRGSICAQDGMAYIRAENDCLYAVDVHEGKISWEFPLTTE